MPEGLCYSSLKTESPKLFGCLCICLIVAVRGCLFVGLFVYSFVRSVFVVVVVVVVIAIDVTC